MPTRLRLVCLALLAAFLFLASPRVVLAQDCGSWREPVLCTGELQVRGAQGWNRFDPSRERLVIPLGETREIELTGRDQTGRTFPSYRLALDHDARDCSSTVDVEDLGEGRLRIRAARTESVCRLDIWVPGNLNFSWRLDVEVSRAPRTSYQRGEAETIARGLYQAILGREGDAGGLSSATAEIQRGNVEGQIRAMIMSPEFQQKQEGLGTDALLARFYRGMLGREPDGVGVRTFAEDMSYRRYTAVLLAIIGSAEYEERLARER